MPPQGVSLRILDRTGCPGQVASEKFAKRPFADEADARRVLLRVSRDAVLARDRPHFAFGERAEREKCASELLLRELMEEVGLVLGRVDRLEQRNAVGSFE